MFNWKTLSCVALLSLLKVVDATTAPGFPVKADGKDLGLTFGGNVVSPAGELIPRDDTASPPNVTTPVWTSAGKGIVMMVDTDVPRNNTRVQLLHWLASNVTLGSDNKTLSVPTRGEASYRQPSPPVGDTPHSYTVLLFSQPSNFSVPSQFSNLLQGRVFWNTSAFVVAAGLESPIAANYIRVQNLSGTPASTPTGGNSSANGTSVSSPGGAGSLNLVGDRAVWAGVGTAVVAGLMAAFL